MTYQEAFKIGGAIEGYVKCTYAKISNTDYGVLFSLQKRNVSMVKEINANVDAATMVLDVPVVRATEFVDGKFVPVVLTDYARQIIMKLGSRKAYKYIVECIYDKDKRFGSNPDDPVIKAGTRNTVLETYTKPDMSQWKNNEYSHFECSKVIADDPEYIAFKESLNNKTAVFEVMASAIDWYPVNIDNATVVDENGVEIKLDFAIEEAQKRLEKAKALLVTAGAATVIL